MRFFVLFLILILAVTALPTHAQDPATPPRPVITSDNWEQLGVVSRIGDGTQRDWVVVSPDGQLALSANNLGVWVHDPAHVNAPAHLLEVGSVYNVVFSSDNRWVVVLFSEHGMGLWDRRQPMTVETLMRLPTDTSVRHVYLSADNNYLIAVPWYTDREAELVPQRWALNTQQLLGTLDPLPEPVEDVQVVGDYWLASPYHYRDDETPVRLWWVSFSTGQGGSIEGKSAEAVTYDPNSRLMAVSVPADENDPYYGGNRVELILINATGTDTQSLGVIDLAYAERRMVLQLWFNAEVTRLMVESEGFFGHRVQIYDINRLLEDGFSTVVEVGNYRVNVASEAAHIPPMPTSADTRRYATDFQRSYGSGFGKAAFEGNLLYSEGFGTSYSDLNIRRLDLSQTLPPVLFGADLERVSDVSLPNQGYGLDPVIVRAEPPTPAYLATSISTRAWSVVSYSADAAWVVGYNRAANTYEVVEVARRTVVRSFDRATTYHVSLSPDGRWVVYVLSENRVYTTWLAPLDQASEPVKLADGNLQMAWSPDSRIIASLGLDRQIRYWFMADDGSLTDQRHDYQAFEHVEAIQFSNDGQLALVKATGGLYLSYSRVFADGVRRFDVRPLPSEIRQAILSPDGTLLAVPTNEGLLWVYGIVE